ncbi:MAG: crossover junction endodeoxyribonuclease RuvC [Clostridium sp.]|uniref:crossover junction endodeoxyribonuclease RuvC n=1 Tax=Clostridium sp. TaxID=1506 RepID=UPI003F353F79
MRLLAIDQALDKSGFSILDEYENLLLYGTLNLTDISRQKDLTKEQKVEERITNVKEFVKRLINTYDVDYVILEDIQAQRNVMTFKSLSSLQGNLKNYLYNNGIPYAILKPSEWRKELGIKGRERKVQKQNTQDYIKRIYRIDVTEDEADSAGLGLSGVRLMKKGKLEFVREV